MKKVIVLLVLISIAFTPATAQALKGQSLNGSTGLYSLPTGRVGWEDSSNFALDLGYRAIVNDSGTAHIPAIAMSLFKFIEISTAYDIQPDPQENDLLFGVKIQLLNKNTAIALGLNVNLIETYNNDFYTYQPYIAITYPGTFFKMPAETTLVIGKTFYSNHNANTDIDFGMGFDLVLFPDVFDGLVHLLMDFSNFGYSSDAWPNPGNVAWRGIFNVGFRFDLSNLPPFKKYKFVLDTAFNDILDHGSRSFTIGAVFGIPLM